MTSEIKRKNVTQKPMLQRNLLYTAITRAKKKVYLVGDYSALLYGIDNNRKSKRYSWLAKRIMQDQGTA